MAEAIGATAIDPAVAATAAAIKASAGEEKGKGPTQAEVLVGYAKGAELFHSPERKAYAAVQVAEHVETWPTMGREFRNWLRHRFFDQTGKGPSAQALQDALGTIEALALFQGPECRVAIRMAEHEGAYYLDLGGPEWSAVKITADGWSTDPQPPVRFIRPRGLAALPPPERGQVEALRPFLNAPDDNAWRLMVAFLVAALRPIGPYPILIFQGEQGSAKSTNARIIRSLSDPSTVSLRATPKEIDDLVIQASSAWVLSFDNLSGTPSWLSDALCRISTGGGFSKRQLFTDDEEVLFDSMRPIILNGISDLGTRPDLADRSLVIHLPPITEEAREPEESLWARFEAARPWILGGLLTALSTAIRERPKVHLERKPRMADFALWSVAAERGLGWEPGSFMAAYSANRREAAETALEADSLATAVLAMAKDAGTWRGTMTELLKDLHRRTELDQRREWKDTPHWLANKLRRVAPILRAHGVEISAGKTTHGRREVHLYIKREKGGETNATFATLATQGSEPADKPGDNPAGSGGVLGGVGGVGGVRVASPESDTPPSKANTGGLFGVGGVGGVPFPSFTKTPHGPYQKPGSLARGKLKRTAAGFEVRSATETEAALAYALLCTPAGQEVLAGLKKVN